MTNLSTAPYFEDFSADKNFYQILFRPGLSVQARELTQIQSILRDQIAKFGNHIFQHGSVVLPGNSYFDSNICYVKLASTLTGLETLVGKVIVGGTSGLRGLIRARTVAVDSDPATIFVSYYNSGNAGEQVFINGETLTLEGTAISYTAAATSATGACTMAFVNRGVFFVNGTFVGVDAQSIVVDKYNATPSAQVLLKITEEIIDADADQTLLDPAQGSYNYAAPGADRLKISLTLTSVPYGTALTDDYVELMRFNVGVLEEHVRYPKYNELEKSLARRTYDEAGDYVVRGLGMTAREHLKSDLNGGRYDLPTGDSTKMLYTVGSGKAYLKGFELEKISATELVIPKARTTVTSSINLTPSFGQYFYVTNIVNLPKFKEREQLTLLNSNTGGSSIGTARVLAIDYQEPNTTDSNAIYRLFVSDVVMTGGNDVSAVGEITFSGGTFDVCNRLVVVPSTSANYSLGETISATSGGTRTAVVQKFTRSTGELYVIKNNASNGIPTVGDIVVGGTSTATSRVSTSGALGKNNTDNLLIALPNSSVYRVKNASNAVDLTYKIYYETTVTCTAGNGSFSVTGMTIDPKDQGNFVIASSAGIHPLSVATVAGDGLSVSFTGVTPASATLKIICAATKTGAQSAPKTKTIVNGFAESGITPASTITLAKADVIRIKSIVSTVDGDVTTRYSFDTGQRDYAYLRGSITLTGTAPSGTLTITYDYFNHNAGSGDFFSVDSYESSGIANYFSTTALIYKSANTGKSYDLRNTLDFRPRVGATGLYTAADGAVINFLAQVDSRITSSIQSYVGRIDAVVMDKSSNLRVIQGSPGSSPVTPVISDDVIYLHNVFVPPYTYKTSDCVITTQKNRGYTMNAIGRIENRISNLEDFVTLSATENKITNYNVIDATTGLNRFKSGYLVDTFTNPDAFSDINNPQFKTAYEFGNIVPQFEIIEAPLTIVANTSQITGNVLTMPYTEVVMAKQPLSSRITNINPFAVFGWTGNMQLTPSSDTWVDVENLQTIYSSTTEYVTVRRPWTWAPVSNVTFAPWVGPVSDGGWNDTSGSSGSSGSDCFTGSTLVTLYDGTKRKISEIKIGDIVLATDMRSWNEVLYVETIPASHHEFLYSPSVDIEPFITNNHPIYIDNQLTVPFNNTVDYPWLKGVKKVKPQRVCATPDEPVYNLWLSGDATYIVNGFGTTSIVGDGGFIRKALTRGFVSHDAGMTLVHSFASTDVYGSYLMNKFIGFIDVKPINSLIVYMTKHKHTMSILNGIVKTVGFFAKVLNK